MIPTITRKKTTPMFHKPVMSDEVISALQIKEGGIYVDVTYGGGGHAAQILDRLRHGQLIGFDQDEAATKQQKQDKRLTLVQHNFRYMKRFLKYHHFFPVNGILADLGVSSHQIDSPARGFSTRFTGDLDLRMDQDRTLTARDIIATYSEIALTQIFSAYGEVRNSKTLARHIVNHRDSHPVKTTDDLKNLIKPVVKGRVSRYLAQVFQALRIEVNDEINALKAFLQQTADVLVNGGRLVVITYHSLEDRLVKRFMKYGRFEHPEPEIRHLPVETTQQTPPLIMLHKKPLTPTEEEVRQNPRARSAKLRVAEKINSKRA